MKILKKFISYIKHISYREQLALMASKTSLQDKIEYNKILQQVIHRSNQPVIEEQKTNSKSEELKDIDNVSHYSKSISDYEEYEKIMNRYLEIENDPKMKSHITKGALDKDINFEFDVKLKDVIVGKKLKIEFMHYCKCTACETTHQAQKCNVCNGLGKYEQSKQIITCESCKGYGSKFLKGNYCKVCQNNLYYERKKEIHFTLGKEFYAGIVYTYPNLGNYDPVTDSYGNLKIKPNIVSDYADDRRTFFKVANESQIESEYLAEISELALGGSIKIKHPNGECEIYINKCTQPDDYKIVNNVGIPIYFDNEEKQMRRGNMVVVFKLKIPSEEVLKNCPEYKKLFEDLQKFENMNELNELNGLSVMKH